MHKEHCLKQSGELFSCSSTRPEELIMKAMQPLDNLHRFPQNTQANPQDEAQVIVLQTPSDEEPWFDYVVGDFVD